MAVALMKKEFQCSSCKMFPRHADTNGRQCSQCSKNFCENCSYHKCSDEGRRNSDVSVPFQVTLELKNYFPYFCKNNKFGCEELFFEEEKVVEHETFCQYQTVFCADIQCKIEVCLLNYFDHFKKSHNDFEDLGDSQTFDLALDIDKARGQVLYVVLKQDVKTKNGNSVEDIQVKWNSCNLLAISS